MCVVAAFNDRASVEDVTEGDIDTLRDFMLKHYACFCGDAKSNKAATAAKPLSNYLSVALHTNSPFIAPTTGDEKRRAQIDELTQPPSMPADAEQCAYCGRAGQRWYRQHVPMLTGEGLINFTPSGAGLAVCPHCIFAIQAHVLGTLKSAGKVFLVHSDSEEFTLQMVREYLKTNQLLIESGPQPDGKYPDAKHPRTRLIYQLQTQAWDLSETAAITAYHMSNSGQGPSLDIYHLPNDILRFIAAAKQHPDTREAWAKAAWRGWVSGYHGKADEQPQTVEGYAGGPHRNQFYEHLFDLPLGADQFVRWNFDWRTSAWAQEPGPQDDLPDAWPLVDLFLRMVMLMHKDRIDAIRTLGDRIADYVVDEGEQRFFNRLFRLSGSGFRDYTALRNLLLKASYARIKADAPPLISFEEFLTAFEEGEEVARSDWVLAKDLLLIRVMDRLHERGWLKEHAAELPDTEEDSDAESEENE